MRIAVVNWTSRRAGGVETYLGRLLPALRGCGHDVLFAYEKHEPATREAISGLAEGPALDLADEPGDGFRALELWRPDVLFVHRLDHPERERVLLGIGPAVFFAHDYYGTCISGTKTTRLPVVQPCDRRFGPACMVHYFPRRCGGLNPATMVSEYRRQSTRLGLLRHYASIVTFSEHMRREYLKHGFNPTKIHCLPVIDPLPGAATQPRGAAGNSTGSPISRISFIGRIDFLKGCRFLIDALPAIRAAVSGRVIVTIAGDGPDLARCQSLAASIATRLEGVEVLFLGWASRAQCEAMLETSDVLAVPSLWPEPLGLVGIEAKRRGVPVAAFAVGGIPEWLIDGRNGALAPSNPPTVAGLAAAVVRCLTDRAIGRAAASDAVNGTSHYSIDTHINNLLAVLSLAAHPHPDSARPVVPAAAAR